MGEIDDGDDGDDERKHRSNEERTTAGSGVPTMVCASAKKMQWDRFML